VFAVFLLGLSACAGNPDERTAANDPHVVVYAYLMAHGMARGYVMSEPVGKDDLARLISVDRTALLAVAQESTQPSPAHLRSATAAVESLLSMLGA